jgi:hexosaminidase
MFDVSRHFFTKKEVMSYIDNMAKYKLNLFHWHLTDDEGWRVEIKSYPKLTTVGAYNVKREGEFGNLSHQNLMSHVPTAVIIHRMISAKW